MAARLMNHPTVKKMLAHPAPPRESGPLDSNWLRRLCLDSGADDVGFVEIDRADIADQRAEIRAIFPGARALVSYVIRTNRESIRTPARSISNLEFHHTGEAVNEVGRRVVAALESRGVRAMNAAAMGFPMEMDRWPRKAWIVSHKPVAVAAGLGHMGIHRNVIHPRFGNFVLLGTLVMDAEVTSYSRPLDFNPCLECKLCVAACPTGAISPEGEFNFAACYTHNYREFMGGFTDWVEKVAESKNARDYRTRVTDSETVSLWQSLGFGPNYYHFTFTGEEKVLATIVIRDQELDVKEGHVGDPDFRLTADSRTWIRFLAKETSLPWAMLRGRIRFRGSPRLLLAFARCFPS